MAQKLNDKIKEESIMIFSDLRIPPNIKIKTFIKTTIGKRETNEDLNFSELVDEIQIIGVLDGHGGVEAADFVKKNFIIEFLKEYKNNKNLSIVLTNTFLMLNTQIINSNITSGTTATIAMIDQDKLFIANVGDSRAILIRNNEIVTLSKDHKITDKYEFEKYRSSNWYKVKSRLISQGKLKGFKMTTISRSLGDSFFEDALTAEPDIKEIKLREGDKIIIATDGLWNFVENERVLAITSKTNTLNSNLTDELIKEAIKSKSTDNITVVVVKV